MALGKPHEKEEAQGGPEHGHLHRATGILEMAADQENAAKRPCIRGWRWFIPRQPMWLGIVGTFL